MARVLGGAYLALVLALLAAAGGIWHLRCESFGCMGIGVAWFAWAGCFLVVLGVGMWARACVESASGMAQLCKAGWWVQLALGAALLVTWALKTAA
jgi:hypothetical protein